MRRILIGVLLTCLWVSTAQAQPAVQITPQTVEAGENIDVTGSGFTPGDTVSALLGVSSTGPRGEPLTSAPVAEDGTFALTFTMPQTWPSGAPISERDLAVYIVKDLEPIASASLTYNLSLAELGWQETYNADFDFSVLVPPDWTFGENAQGFTFTLSGTETIAPVVILTAQAIALPQEVDAAAAVMSLEEYVQASPELETRQEEAGEFIILNQTPITTLSGEEGMVADWMVHGEDGVMLSSGKTAYFDLRESVDGFLYRTIQIRATDSAVPFFDAVVSSFTRGHQQVSPCETSTDAVEGDPMDTRSLIQAFCANGANVLDGGDLPEISIPIFHAPGHFWIVNGERMQIYEYPDEATAQAVRDNPARSSIGATEVGWDVPPHFFGAGKVIVLYAGDEPDVLRLLETVLGPQVAGRPMP